MDLDAVATELVGAALWETVTRAVFRLRARTSPWADRVVDRVVAAGVPLDDEERSRLARVLAHTPKETFSELADRAVLLALLHDNVFLTHDTRPVAPPASPAERLARNDEMAHRVLDHLWEAVLGALEPDERRSLLADLAATRTLEMAQAVLDHLEAGTGSETVVTTAGEGPEAAAGDRLRLPLEAARLRPPPGATLAPYHLLWPRFGTVPFDDRAGWLADLRRWCEAPDRAAVAVIRGPGGMGKTRIALELCRSMARRGWVAGFYRASGREPVARLAGLRHPRLVVVDYAELDADEAFDLIARLADQLPTRAARVRVVLLLRRHDRFQRAAQRQSRASLLVNNAMTLTVGVGTTAATPHVTASAFELADRQRLYVGACEAFGAPVVDIDLGAPVHATPLFVLLAAVLQVPVPSAGVGSQEAPATTREELLDRVLAREAAIQWQGAPEVDADLTRRAVTVTTLLGAEDEDELVAHLRNTEPWIDSGADALRMARWLHRLYDGHLWANPLEPDVLGERLVATSLPVSYLDHVFTLPAARPLVRALTVLARVVEASPEWAEPVRRRLVHQVERLVADAATQDRAEDANGHPLAPALVSLLESVDIGEHALLPQLPDRVAGRIAPLAEVLARQVVGWARSRSELSTLLAESLNNWSVRLTDVGRLGDALTVSLEAKEVADGVGLRSSDRRGYASLLQTLSNNLARNDRVAEALDRSSDALAIRRTLGTDSEEDAADLASVLIVHADRLGRRGSFDEAVAHIDEAVARLRNLRTPREAELATALDSGSVWHQRAGNQSRAIGQAQDALALRRRLAAADPTRFGEELATSLTNLAIWLGGAGQPGEALALTEEAVEVCRAFLDDNPGRFRPALAGALNAAGNRLLELEQPRAALPLVVEAVEHRRRLYDEVPAAHALDLATSLGVLSLCLGRLGDLETSISVGEESIEIRSRLADGAGGGRYRHELAVALSNQANRLAVAGKTDEAIRRSEAAVAHLRSIEEDYRGARRDLSTALLVYANRLADVGEVERALLAVGEAVAIRRDLPEPSLADDFRLGRSLRLRGSWLRLLGSIEPAVESLLEAVELLARSQATSAQRRELRLARQELDELQALIDDPPV